VLQKILNLPVHVSGAVDSGSVGYDVVVGFAVALFRFFLELGSQYCRLSGDLAHWSLSRSPLLM
jgi:hypothetical protein